MFCARNLLESGDWCSLVHSITISTTTYGGKAPPIKVFGNTIDTQLFEYGADSIEWCPHEPYEQVFVCGNYELKETECLSTIRFGRVLLLSVLPHNGLKLHQVINRGAILDQKWCPNKINNETMLGVATASGIIEIYKLKEQIHLELISFYKVQNTCETLILSLDWSTGLHISNEPEMICSDSKGNLHLLKLINGELVLQNSWHGHEFEAWITGFYYWDPNIVFSGGDDSIFLKFDTRIGQKAIAKNKLHTAGVTSLHSNKSKEYVIATGSYDEQIRLWDTRNLKNQINSIKLPGSLWRLKWDPFTQNYLLAACMLSGAYLVDVRNLDEIKIIGNVSEHKSICYGADWSYLGSDYCKKFDSEATTLIGTCSFYDHLLCISKISSDNK